jgi:hypothetical protein
MKTAGLLVSGFAIWAGVASVARADVVPPDVAECNQAGAAGASCSSQTGISGICIWDTCSRLDYANWNHDASGGPPSMQYACLRCVVSGDGGLGNAGGAGGQGGASAQGGSGGTSATGGKSVLGGTTATGGTAGRSTTAPAAGGAAGQSTAAPATGGTAGQSTTAPATGGTTGQSTTAPATGGTTGQSTTAPATGGTAGQSTTAPATGGTNSGGAVTAGTGGTGGNDQNNQSDSGGCAVAGWLSVKTFGPWLLASLFGAIVMLARRRRR